MKTLYLIFTIIFISISFGSFSNNYGDNLTVGTYTEFPITDGIYLNHSIKSDYFINFKYGQMPKRYTKQIGNVMAIIYSEDLLVQKMRMVIDSSKYGTWYLCNMSKYLRKKG